MTKRIYADINPKMLIWAREQAHYSLDEAAQKLKQPATKLVTWESGERKPTIFQIRNLGKLYHRPSAFFYLETPPPPPPELADYRTIENLQQEVSPKLSYEIRNARDRRQIALDVSKLLEIEIPEFSIAINPKMNPEESGTLIRKKLHIKPDQQFAWSHEYEALNSWIKAIEALGVLVFQFSGIPVKQVRGFSITSNFLPTISLNGKDSPTGRIFSLLHELCHVSLGIGGLCDLVERNDSSSIEEFCNAVAAEILVPQDLLLSQNEVARHYGGVIWKNEEIEVLSRQFRVSREVILRRLLTIGLTSRYFYLSKRQEYLKEYSQAPKETGGYMPYQKKVIRENGIAFSSLVLDAYNQRSISAIDVSRYLGNIRLNHLQDIQGEILGKT